MKALKMKFAAAAAFCAQHEKAMQLAFFALCAVYYFIHAVKLPYNGGADEAMRYLVPVYIYDHNALPTGWEESVRNAYWGFSYAFYPTLLPSILGTLCMKICRIFTGDGFALLVAARVVDVLSGAGAVYFVLKLLTRIVKRPWNWMAAVFMALIPQYAHVSSYFNNDMPAVFGISMILCAWVYAALDGWNVKNSLLLTAGIIVVGLSYYNAYSWVLMSAVFFLGTQEKGIFAKGEEGKKKRRNALKCMLLIVGISAVCILPLFIRNIVVNGDLLGMKTVAASTAIYGDKDFYATLPTTYQAQGRTVLDMLSDGSCYFIKKVLLSFFGAFGYSKVFIPYKYLGVYMTFIMLGIFGFIFALLNAGVNKEPLLGDSGLRGRKAGMLMVCASAASMISAGLAIWYSYASDYQPQGRYYYPVLPAMMLMIAIGYKMVGKHPRLLRLFACVTMIAMMYEAYFHALVYLVD